MALHMMRADQLRELLSKLSDTAVWSRLQRGVRRHCGGTAAWRAACSGAVAWHAVRALARCRFLCEHELAHCRFLCEQEKSSSSAPAATKKASAAGEKRKAEKAPTARAKSGGSKGTKA